MISVLFVLLQSVTAPPAAPVANAPQAAMHKKICRSSAETGSLVRKNKVCLTRAQWQQREDENKEAIREVQNRINSARPN